MIVPSNEPDTIIVPSNVREIQVTSFLQLLSKYFIEGLTSDRERIVVCYHLSSVLDSDFASKTTRIGISFR